MTVPALGMPGVVVALLLTVCAACVLLVVGWPALSQRLPTVCGQWVGGVLPERACTAGMGKLLTYSWTLAVLPLILLLEWWRPADPTQPLFSPGLLVDLLWFLTFPVLGVWLPGVWDQLLHATLGVAVAGFQLPLMAALPVAGQFVVVIVLADFLAWLSHYTRHKVPMFWEFHKIHHSQEQLNYFSAQRLHPLDLFANALIRFLPWTLLGLSRALPGYLIWTTFLRMFEMFVHANIRSNLGLLRYVIVTPQTHRVHHSLEPRHMDKNFGNCFALWDFLFRTQCTEFQVYPALGVDDVACPRGKATTVREALRVFARELAYPVRAVAAQVRLPVHGS
jgi:sterol desaturase/sphingolipid hydroxylase (fatty acid hydroxylase superfamily)